MTLLSRGFLLLCLSWLVIATVVAKINDKYLLSKCACSDFGKADCDFSKLSKKNLRKLVDRLLNSRIVCVKSDQYFLPTFTASLFTTPQVPSQMEVSSTKSEEKPSKTKEMSCPAPIVRNETVIQYRDISNCQLNGLQCSTKQGVEFLFPTPLLVHQILVDKQAKQYNEELKDLLLELEEEDNGCKFNLHGGYRSKDQFLSRKEPAVQWLRSQIVPRINYMLSLANATDIEFEIDGWGAVMRGGDAQNAHVHPGSLYAGVYYVTAPKEIAESGKSGGCLFFFDPRNGAEMAQVTRGKSIYGEPIEICPPAGGGTLVIFPSWLMHKVNTIPLNYEGPRIGISFNAIYKPLLDFRGGKIMKD